MMKIIDCEQRSGTWFALRTGIVTCSHLESVFSKGKGKGRLTYAYKIAAERLINSTTQYGTSEAMERGILLEPEAREAYEIHSFQNVQQVGFCLDEKLQLGYSPDGFVGDAGLVEIKTKAPHLQMEVLDKGEVPEDHVAQLQGGLLVTGRQWIDFVSYCPGLPLFVKRVLPDPKYHESIKEELVNFYTTVSQIVAKVNSEEVQP